MVPLILILAFLIGLAPIGRKTKALKDKTETADPVEESVLAAEPKSESAAEAAPAPADEPVPVEEPEPGLVAEDPTVSAEESTPVAGPESEPASIEELPPVADQPEPAAGDVPAPRADAGAIIDIELVEETAPASAESSSESVEPETPKPA